PSRWPPRRDGASEAKGRQSSWFLRWKARSFPRRLPVYRGPAPPQGASDTPVTRRVLGATRPEVSPLRLQTRTRTRDRSGAPSDPKSGRVRLRERRTKRGLFHELDRDRRRNDAGPVSLVEKPAHRLAAARAVIQRPVVDVHADEPVRELPVHVAGILQGVGK